MRQNEFSTKNQSNFLPVPNFGRFSCQVLLKIFKLVDVGAFGGGFAYVSAPARLVHRLEHGLVPVFGLVDGGL